MSKEKELHIMFIDISGFTQISEELTAKESLLLLNIYFD
jgi:class 3 adenylate cyclase